MTLDGLDAVLGPGRISIEANDLALHGSDWSTSAFIARRRGEAQKPACVVRPRSSAEVSALLSWAHGTHTPVVPFGGGSGVCSAIAPDGMVVIDMRDMDRLVELDEKSRLVTVEAGMTGPQVQATLASSGYTLGHEPQSVAISTVGGWLATRACGQLSARFGGIEDLVCGLEAVLAPGTTVRQKPAPRRAAGPDVASLLIGSEGTLGIITQATLRIAPQSSRRVDHCARFEHMDDGVAAVRNLAQSELKPTLVRLYDRDDTAIFLREHEGAPSGPLLLLSFDGFEAKARAASAAKTCGGEQIDASLVAYWWDHRNDAVDAYRSLMAGDGLLGPHAVVDTMETSAIWSRLRGLYHSVRDALGGDTDFLGCHLSHVYPDGACLYFTMASAPDSDDAAQALDDRWWDLAMPAVLGAGGSISHHHGIGRRKDAWLAEELGGWWDALVAVKSALDPHRIMNPGALGL